MTSRIQAISSLAARLMAGELPADRLGSAVAAAHLTRVPSRVVAQVNTEIDRSPSRARALALVVQEIARRSNGPRDRAQALILNIRTLNSLGEFRSAVAAGQHAGRALTASRDLQLAARVWLEAAYAETHLAHLDHARRHLGLAGQLASRRNDLELRARSDWIEGRILREKGDYAKAHCRFERARAWFRQTGDLLNAARCLLEIGHNRTRTDAAAALPILEQTRRTFQRVKCPVEIALCDHFAGQALHKLGRFQEALEKLAASREVFLDAGIDFYASWAAMETGIVQWYLGHFQVALPLFEGARDYFLEHGVDSEASACDINIAALLLLQNRYEPALVRLRSAARAAVGLGQRKKAAICFLNMGYAYEKQGRYAPALESYQRAREEFVAEEMVDQIARSDLNIGFTLFNLGEYGESLLALDRAADLARSHALKATLAECLLDRGSVLLALGRAGEAHAAWLRARELFVQAGQEVHVAVADYRLAGAEALDNQRALARLKASREVFCAHGQTVDAALCDLTQGELHLAWGEWQDARPYLERAREVLYPGFPDDAWRADYALGKVALAQGMQSTAKQHYLSAVSAITSMRVGLGVERLSNNLLSTRQRVFVDALNLTLAEPDNYEALGVIQAAKAQTVLAWLGGRDGRARPLACDDVESAALIRRERDLRSRLGGLRRRVSLASAYTGGEPLRGSPDLESASSESLGELNEAARDYDSVASSLRLTWRGLSGVPTLAPFSAESFRDKAWARWGKRWTALEYHLSGDDLTLARLDSDELKIERVRLTPRDRAALARCAGTDPSLRELAYRGLANAGSPVTSDCLRQLGDKLIPTQVRTLEGEHTLIIAPHGHLHYMPFQALMDGDDYLIDRFNLVYTPSLQILGQMMSDAPGGGDHSRILLCGLDEFGGRAFPLRHAREEIESCKARDSDNATILWKADATRQRVMELNDSGELGEFGVIHFATHSILQPDAPHASRILLADDDLTVLDVMDLGLEARLVILSGCSTALGAEGSGDEFLGLARAFFYAGARALVATLWAVDDESTARLMAEFHRKLGEGNSIACALRSAQIALRRAGQPPYYWAPFVAIGLA